MDQTLNIKERLILAALELFAEQGIHGVSMRNINVLAGTKNSGAAHYHFGNKLGLLEALLAYLNTEIGMLREARFEALKSLDRTELKPRQVLESFYAPYVELYQQRSFGPKAIKFYARLAVEGDPKIQELINQYHSRTFQTLDEYMAWALPDVNRTWMRRQLLFSWISAIHGLADLEYMHNTFFGDLSTDSMDELMDQFLDFISAGMLGLQQESTNKGKDSGSAIA
ncbi:transcriptional regulator, TetR family protein [gamma proteobacterium HTCC5015]|nr:transcriptional regulator, TetR family protein [gamma proteobacterium HTCC5015]